MWVTYLFSCKEHSRVVYPYIQVWRKLTPISFINKNKKMNVSYKYFCSFKLDAGKLYLRFCLSKCISKDLQVFKLIDAARMKTVFFFYLYPRIRWIHCSVYIHCNIRLQLSVLYDGWSLRQIITEHIHRNCQESMQEIITCKCSY